VKDSYKTVVITRTEWELDFLRMALPDSMRGIVDREEGRMGGWIDDTCIHIRIHANIQMVVYTERLTQISCISPVNNAYI
jgi:hypothetical protein